LVHKNKNYLGFTWDFKENAKIKIKNKNLVTAKYIVATRFFIEFSGNKGCESIFV